MLTVSVRYCVMYVIQLVDMNGLLAVGLLALIAEVCIAATIVDSYISSGKDCYKVLQSINHGLPM